MYEVLIKRLRIVGESESEYRMIDVLEDTQYNFERFATDLNRSRNYLVEFRYSGDGMVKKDDVINYGEDRYVWIDSLHYNSYSTVLAVVKGVLPPIRSRGTDHVLTLELFDTTQMVKLKVFHAEMEFRQFYVDKIYQFKNIKLNDKADGAIISRIGDITEFTNSGDMKYRYLASEYQLGLFDSNELADLTGIVCYVENGAGHSMVHLSGETAKYTIKMSRQNTIRKLERYRITNLRHLRMNEYESSKNTEVIKEAGRKKEEKENSGKMFRKTEEVVTGEMENEKGDEIRCYRVKLVDFEARNENRAIKYYGTVLLQDGSKHMVVVRNEYRMKLEEYNFINGSRGMVDSSEYITVTLSGEMDEITGILVNNEMIRRKIH